MEAFKEKGDEFDNIKLNDMFSLSYNFDITLNMELFNKVLIEIFNRTQNRQSI